MKASYKFNGLLARDDKQQTEFVGKVTFAHKWSEHGEKAGVELAEFADRVAAREAAGQLADLVTYRRALDKLATYVPLVGRMYPWDVVGWICAASEYNYLPQFVAADIISEPQGGLVAIDWRAASALAAQADEVSDIIDSLLFGGR